MDSFGQPTAPLAMNDSMPAASYSARGGARIGWVNYTWPLASLSVDTSSLTIVTTFFGLFEMGRYSFRPDQVARIVRFGWLPIIGEGIRVHHTVADYPEKVVFWCRPSAVLRGIASTGFPTTSESTDSVTSIPSRGFPLRIWPLVIVVLLWNLLLGYEFFYRPMLAAFPGTCTIAALSLVFVTSLAVLFSPSVQAIFLRPGRTIGEVRPMFLLVATIAGIMTVVFTVVFLAEGIRRVPRPNKARVPTAGDAVSSFRKWLLWQQQGSDQQACDALYAQALLCDRTFGSWSGLNGHQQVAWPQQFHNNHGLSAEDGRLEER